MWVGEKGGGGARGEEVVLEEGVQAAAQRAQRVEQSNQGRRVC